MTLLELYQSWGADGKHGEDSRALLEQTHWFTSNAVFDPRTGQALPQALSAFLAKVARSDEPARNQDRLARITDHARPAIERLFRTLNENPRREHALLHVRAVRELDAGSFIKLSNRPGRNIREKLAGKPYLQAVRRFQSVNLSENRLLRAFVTRLEELLELRADYLREQEDDLLAKIQSWLRSDEAHAIGRWENPPPNNTLLSHRDYRRVWDAWRWLQTLDDDIDRDFSNLKARAETMRQWIEYGQMYSKGTHRFADMPIRFDYEKFEIRPWIPEKRDAPWRLPLHAVQNAPQKIARFLKTKEILGPVCVDLAVMRPRYAISAVGAESLPETLLWQQWRRGDEAVDIELFNSDAAYFHPDATSISSADLFFSKDSIDENLDRAARAFAARLRDTFKGDKLIWLVPDALNDFELPIIRRNLNARFLGAEPLPRSVAAIFEQVNYTRITNDGYPVLVVDTLGGTTCATKLIARFDSDLKTRLPATNGYYWERCPPVVISGGNAEKGQRYDMVTVDGNGNWRNRAAPKQPQPIAANHLKADPRIGNFAFCIYLSDSPVAGGMRFHVMQARTGDIPLWRDQIPELSVKVMKDGRYQRFHLVSRGTTIKPIRGHSVRIPIAERFTLPAGKQIYQFPLFQGENAAQLRRSAHLDSPAFPLKSNTECELILTFRYGDDEPYNLVFVPFDKSLPTVRATWQRTVEEVVTDAPAPCYPSPLMWVALQRMPKPDSAETRDLLEWVVSAIDRLDRPRKVGTLTTDWRTDRNGYHFARAKWNETTEVFIHERSFVEGVTYLSFKRGDLLSFELQERDGSFAGAKVALPNYGEKPGEVIKRIRKGLHFPIIQVWRDGRSITDIECPKPFATAASERIACLTDLALQDDLPASVKHEFLFLLACVHKDTSDECVRWVVDQVESGRIRDVRAVGFALGDVSQKWQQKIFHRLVSHPNNDAISIFAYAIWRERYFVERFSLSELKASLKVLLKRLNNICSVQESDLSNNSTRRDWERATTESLEFLLGLLRTRTSDDSETRMLLQPHQKITKQFAEQIDRIEEIVAESNIMLFSRVQINVQKPDGVRSPDLLHALRLYLTGDDGANAIHITGVSDSDNH